jgi:hypothetical protein
MRNRNTKREEGGEKWLLPRRDFLALGSAAVVGAAAWDVSARSRAVGTSSPGSVLSIGYARPQSAPDEVRVVMSALSGVSDTSFRVTGARVILHGVSTPDETRAVSIRVTTFAPTEIGSVPFLAWERTFVGSGHSTFSPGIAFLAALDADGTLPIALERYEAASPWASRLALSAPTSAAVPQLQGLESAGSVLRLSSGGKGDAALAEGTYFVALRRTSSDREPNWSSIEIDPAAKDPSTSLRRNAGPVDFEYMAFTIARPVAA